MSRIWDVNGIEWEDLPTVSDLLCAADTKILAREVALRYGGGKPDGRGRGDSERNLKRVRRKVKKLRKIDPIPATKLSCCPSMSSIVAVRAMALAITTWSRAPLRAVARKGRERTRVPKRIRGNCSC